MSTNKHFYVVTISNIHKSFKNGFITNTANYRPMSQVKKFGFMPNTSKLKKPQFRTEIFWSLQCLELSEKIGLKTGVIKEIENP